jgi:energy-coupling factor transporter transmembrane protein EcfT
MFWHDTWITGKLWVYLALCLVYVFLYNIYTFITFQNVLYCFCMHSKNLISTGWFMVWFMMINATFNNILTISWQSVLLAEETGVPGENHRPVASHWETSSHNIVSSTPRHKRGSNSQLQWFSGTNCTGSCKSNYHTITTRTPPSPHLTCVIFCLKPQNTTDMYLMFQWKRASLCVKS